ncbi:rod shape-determining protein MreC [bacterium]|nr:rod shape-determining protein MreC [bacterium]
MPTQKKFAFFGMMTLCVCVLALYIYRHRQGETGRIDSVLISVSGGLQQNFFFLGKGGRSIIDHYLTLVNTQKRNEALEKEVEYLRTKVTALQEVDLENGRLRKGLDFRSDLTQKLLAAHVIANDISTDYFALRIDRGSRDGIRPGMGVISPSGLVGRILRVTNDYSDVLTLLDPTSNVDVVIQRSRARGVLSGKAGEVRCSMKYIDRLDDVTSSDTVVASGFGNVFPKGLLVGYVTDVEPDRNGVIKNVTVKSAVDIYRLEEVFIVLPPAESEKAAKQS